MREKGKTQRGDSKLQQKETETEGSRSEQSDPQEAPGHDRRLLPGTVLQRQEGVEEGEVQEGGIRQQERQGEKVEQGREGEEETLAEIVEILIHAQQYTESGSLVHYHKVLLTCFVGSCYLEIGLNDSCRSANQPWGTSMENSHDLMNV